MEFLPCFHFDDFHLSRCHYSTRHLLYKLRNKIWEVEPNRQNSTRHNFSSAKNGKKWSKILSQNKVSSNFSQPSLKNQLFIQQFLRILCLKNVNFVKNETPKMRIFSKTLEKLWIFVKQVSFFISRFFFKIKKSGIFTL